MAERLRIGSLEFLNARPLVEGLEAEAGVSVRRAAPSALGPMLARGEVEAALVPSVEYFRLAAGLGERVRGGGPSRLVGLRVAAIGSRGAVGSVRVFGYKARAEVRRVALDPASRTANAMARLLLVRMLGRRVHFASPEEGAGARAADAEVVIGDAGLVAERPGAAWVLDLGEAWEEAWGEPFVYAFWAARADAPLGRAAAVLEAARDRGLAAREAIASRAEAEHGVPALAARRYLMEQVRYGFGRAEQRGLETFRRLAAEDGLVPEHVRLHLAETATGRR